MRYIKLHYAIAILIATLQPAKSDATLSCVAPAPTSKFLDSFAVNTHIQQGWQYSDAAKTVATLKSLGITQIRDTFTGLGHAGLEYAARNGIKFDFIIAPGWGKNVIPALESWEKEYPNSILSIEGPNEVNNWPVNYDGLTGIPAAQAFQRNLYDGVHSSSVLRHIPVLALTSWPVFVNKSDIGNIHAYSRTGEHLSPNIKSAIDAEKRGNPPDKKIWMTEAGYTTHIGSDYFEGVSEDVQAKMIASLFLSAFGQGVEKTFIYQLADQYTDPNDQAAFFGLVDLKWRTKPAFNVLRNMISILDRMDGPDGSAGVKPLAFAIDGAPSTAKHILFQAQKAWLLAIWNETEIWNSSTHQEAQLPAAELTVRFQESLSEVKIFDPFVGLDAVETERNVNSIKLKLADHPLFVTASVASTSRNATPACALAK